MTFRIHTAKGGNYDKKTTVRIKTTVEVADHMGNAERLELRVESEDNHVVIGGVDLDLVFQALANTKRYGGSDVAGR